MPVGLPVVPADTAEEVEEATRIAARLQTLEKIDAAAKVSQLPAVQFHVQREMRSLTKLSRSRPCELLQEPFPDGDAGALLEGHEIDTLCEADENPWTDEEYGGDEHGEERMSSDDDDHGTRAREARVPVSLPVVAADIEFVFKIPAAADSNILSHSTSSGLTKS